MFFYILPKKKKSLPKAACISKLCYHTSCSTLNDMALVSLPARDFKVRHVGITDCRKLKLIRVECLQMA